MEAMSCSLCEMEGSLKDCETRLEMLVVVVVVVVVDGVVVALWKDEAGKSVVRFKQTQTDKNKFEIFF